MRFRGNAVRAGLIGLFTFLSLSVPVAVSGASQAASEPGDSPEKVSSPSSFDLDYESAIASDGKHLWLATTGKSDTGSFRTEVLEFRNDDWSPLEGRPSTGTNYPLQMAAWKRPGSGKTTPCLGDTPNSGARIRCYGDGKWKQITSPPSSRA